MSENLEIPTCGFFFSSIVSSTTKQCGQEVEQVRWHGGNDILEFFCVQNNDWSLCHLVETLKRVRVRRMMLNLTADEQSWPRKAWWFDAWSIVRFVCRLSAWEPDITQRQTVRWHQRGSTKCTANAWFKAPSTASFVPTGRPVHERLSVLQQITTLANKVKNATNFKTFKTKKVSHHDTLAHMCTGQNRICKYWDSTVYAYCRNCCFWRLFSCIHCFVACPKAQRFFQVARKRFHFAVGYSEWSPQEVSRFIVNDVSIEKIEARCWSCSFVIRLVNACF